jgi:methionyl-tRNA formyltransferase
VFGRRGVAGLDPQGNDEKNIGVTLMFMDEKMDHGPIIAQEVISIPNWPVGFERLEEITAKIGIKLFVEKLNSWIDGKIKPVEQNHTEATFTKKVEKVDGLLDKEFAKPYENYLKTLAFQPWPGTFFFINKNGQKIRVIIKDSEYTDGKFIIKKVLPEGKKEMSYDDFLRGLK